MKYNILVDIVVHHTFGCYNILILHSIIPCISRHTLISIYIDGYDYQIRILNISTDKIAIMSRLIMLFIFFALLCITASKNNIITSKTITSHIDNSKFN